MGQKQSYDVNDNRHNTAADGEVAYEVDSRLRGQPHAVEMRPAEQPVAHAKNQPSTEEHKGPESVASAPEPHVEHAEVHETHVEHKHLEVTAHLLQVS